MTSKRLLGLVVIVGLAIVLASLVACSSSTAEEEATLTAEACTACHVSSDQMIVAKHIQWEESGHGMGTAYVRGTSASCAGCHAGEGFSMMVAAGLSSPEDVQEGVANPAPQNCRTCHQIHTSYSSADWALETTAPVTLYASGDTYDGGEGNLCVNCHQPRRVIVAENGIVDVSSTHWGPHHGPQSAMLLGVVGAGDVSGRVSVHYQAVEDTCVTCHMVNDNHTFEPNVAACTACHTDAKNFDIDGVQTEVKGLVLELEQLLYNKGLLATAGHEPYHPGESDLHPVVGKYPEAEANALWNYIYIAVEDSSMGVHNPSYTKALLKASIDALK